MKGMREVERPPVLMRFGDIKSGAYELASMGSTPSKLARFEKLPKERESVFGSRRCFR